VVLCRSAVPMHVDVAIAGAGPAGLAAAAALRKADPNLKVSQADTQADRQHLLWVWTC
jgi:2-polyprenyl-6-methoxyphenol hydroxylase-like FAD-dependent oxidoreductase